MKKLFQDYKSYMQDNPNGYWFKRKLYGWGWTPATWQGWIVTVAYVCIIVPLALTIDESSSPHEIFFMLILPIVLCTISLVAIAYKKGEKPKWQWGL